MLHDPEEFQAAHKVGCSRPDHIRKVAVGFSAGVPSPGVIPNFSEDSAGTAQIIYRAFHERTSFGATDAIELLSLMGCVSSPKKAARSRRARLLLASKAAVFRLAISMP
jgi:hypothetical protein